MKRLIFRMGMVVGLALLLTGSAFAGVAGKKFAQETANGEYAIAVAAGNVDHPKAIYLRVKSRPHQKVQGSWTVICSRGYGAGSKSGDFEGQTTLDRKLKMSYRNPSSCTASAAAQLSDGGFIKVQLYATH
jgi:hypothetical protein